MMHDLRVVMLGATGAVGTEAAKALLAMPAVTQLTLLGRRPWDGAHNMTEQMAAGARLRQHTIDIFAPASYAAHLAGHDIALCTLGVSQPGKISRTEFLRIDRDAALDFARACKSAGIKHFSMLTSVGSNSRSAAFYLRSKGELEDGLRALGFARLSLFQPSMILTPTNRFGISQALTLAVWPHLQPLLFGALRKYRGIRVEQLGQAMARNIVRQASGAEVLQWDQFIALCG